MSLFAIMVTRNEADRYLECALSAVSAQVDGVVVYDDRSDDDTVAVARCFTDMVAVRDESTPPFLEHEGQFRQASWGALERLANPQNGDWVLSIDADEILAATDVQLSTMMRTADAGGSLVVDIPIAELFQLDPPASRADGYWGTIRGKRLSRWRPNAEFADQPMASGSAPTYTKESGTLLLNSGEGRIVHLGYADPNDRRAKHDRYVGLPGHSARHVASILERPILRPWDGPDLMVWRGRKGTP